MLKKRILTAAILIPLVVLFIFLTSPCIFSILSLALVLFALKEWFALAGLQKDAPFKIIIQAFLLSALIFGLIFGVITILAYLFGMDVVHHHLFLLFAAMACVWIFPIWAVFTFPKGSEFYGFGFKSLAIGILLLGSAWFSLVTLKKWDPKWVLYVLMLVWVADSFAYFAGKRFGRHPLAQKVSPGKTWEGVLGGLLGSLIFAYFIYVYFSLDLPLFFWMIMNACVVLVSVIGDLFESIFKRIHRLKDSGNLLPGHGGILDRIDAQLSALPTFTFLLIISKLIF